MSSILNCDSPRDPRDGLRVGDRVTAKGLILADRIKWGEIRVDKPNLQPGDRVSWREEGSELTGEVLAVDVDSLDKTTHVWAKVDGQWPRRSLSLTHTVVTRLD